MGEVRNAFSERCHERLAPTQCFLFEQPYFILLSQNNPVTATALGAGNIPLGSRFIFCNACEISLPAREAYTAHIRTGIYLTTQRVLNEQYMRHRLAWY